MGIAKFRFRIWQWRFSILCLLLFVICCSLTVFYSQDDKDIIDLTKDTSPNKAVADVFSISNAVVIIVIVVLLCCVYILTKLLKKKDNMSAKSIYLIDKFYLDSKITIYVLKVYGELIKIAVSKNGVTFLGSMKEGSSEFTYLIKEGNGTDKVKATSTYMKIVDDINNINQKIDNWKTNVP